jgi:copper homeostasis protein
MSNILEICAGSVQSAHAALAGGAQRVELCGALEVGGITPSVGLIRAVRAIEGLKVHVLIRSRGGDFLYSDLEREIMLEDVRMARRLGVDGVVFGVLTSDGDIDMDFMRQLMAESEGMSVTFHRAFDVCRNPFVALEQIIELGCDRILTSGQMPKAEDGVDLLKQLVEKAGDRIIIMPGCGVNAGNIAKIAQITGAKEFHFSARSKHESGMQFRKSRVSMGGSVMIDEYSRDVTDELIVKDIIAKLNV